MRALRVVGIIKEKKIFGTLCGETTANSLPHERDWAGEIWISS